MARHASVEALSRYSRDLLQSAGADETSAEAATWAVLHASLHGVDSHGVRLLPWYANGLRAGLIKGAPNITVRKSVISLPLACFSADHELFMHL